MSINVINVDVLAFVIAEVNRQGHPFWDAGYNVTPLTDGAQRTIWMLESWEWMLLRASFNPKTTNEMIQVLGSMVEPEKNEKGFRRVGVRVGMDVKPNWAQVPRLTKQLCEANDQGNLSPSEFYKEFQEIHPFVDGNGRTGKILFNWLNGTLEKPVMPPNFWNVLNP